MLRGNFQTDCKSWGGGEKEKNHRDGDKDAYTEDKERKIMDDIIQHASKIEINKII